MVNILIVRNESGNVCRLKVAGHSGYDEIGRDIVCSAISAIVQTMVIGLKDVVGIRPLYHQKSGLADLKIPDDLSEEKIKKANILLETGLLGLRSIESGYGEYVDIRERKVE
ncbi:MAG TPA: ribosomal-processing cysteine protease Prp [Clostridia bacterium]|nr:ribosomal-processing cysteine protease Prp [Clostridia bacterium]